MSAENSLRAGRPEQALEELKAVVQKDPSNARHRAFLFQLLAVLGRWERALAQLKVAGELDAAYLPMVQTYREAIRCELLRAEVFAGRRAPLIFGEPEPWIAYLLEALRLTASGSFLAATEMRARAFDAAPATPGRLEGQPFEWLADADPRLGPVTDVIIQGRYYWMPLRRLRSVRVEPATDLRDLVWMPAYLTLATGAEIPALIPTRYPGSEASKDPQIVLARKTEWVAHEGETFLGEGQRMLATDRAEHALMDLRDIQLDSPAEPDAHAGRPAADTPHG